jgi:hypothetical protein
MYCPVEATSTEGSYTLRGKPARSTAGRARAPKGAAPKEQAPPFL